MRMLGLQSRSDCSKQNAEQPASDSSILSSLNNPEAVPLLRPLITTPRERTHHSSPRFSFTPRPFYHRRTLDTRVRGTTSRLDPMEKHP